MRLVFFLMPTNRIWISQRLLWLSKWVTLSNMTFTMTFMTFVMTFVWLSKPKVINHKWRQNKLYDEFSAGFMTFMSFGRLYYPYLFFGIPFFFFVAPRSQVSQKSWKSYFLAILAFWRHLSVWRLKLKVIFFGSKVIFENESHIAKSTSKEKSPNFPYHNAWKGGQGENQILKWRVAGFIG